MRRSFCSRHVAQLEFMPGFFRRFRSRIHAPPDGSGETSAAYWTRHNVTQHERFTSRAHSLEYLAWRNAQYLFYDALLPAAGHDGEVVVDYGCGPGNDLVGFLERSRPGRLIGVDVSSASLAQAKERLALHPGTAELILIREDEGRLPFEDASVDYVHSSGVLHHTPDPLEIMREFRRILRPGGRAGIMVYNRASLWMHLYVAYQRRILQGIDATCSLEDAFRRSTDGPDCPISTSYEPAQFLSLCAEAGFDGRFVGAAISLHEMGLLPGRYAALQDPRLPAAHREFLGALTFDDYARPRHNGEVAGIDAVFELTLRDA